MRYLLDHGQLIVATVAAIFSICAYLLTRRRELAWKRTEFLFAQYQYFENDRELLETTTILEERHSTITVDQVFSLDSMLDDAKRKEYAQKFDKLLNFLWRLCYARLETKTLSLKEVEAFGWYLWRISESEVLREYCENNGFDEIVIVIKELKPIWAEYDREG
jgi:hypothetical protein